MAWDKKQKQADAEQKQRETEVERRRQAEFDRKAAAFRKNLQVGDETHRGLVIEIKGNLVKLQTTTEQCTQRDYRGRCVNFINTPIEKWVKRSDIYPR